MNDPEIIWYEKLSDEVYLLHFPLLTFYTTFRDSLKRLANLFSQTPEFDFHSNSELLTVVAAHVEPHPSDNMAEYVSRTLRLDKHYMQILRRVVSMHDPLFNYALRKIE